MISDSNRMWASASFVGVLIVIGLPLWWKTTEVYRVSLPYDKINSFDPMIHYITTKLTILADDATTAADAAREIQLAFKDTDIIKLDIKTLVLPDSLQNSMGIIADDQEAVEEVSTSFDLEQHNSFYVVQRKPLSRDVWVGRERIAFFRDSKAVPTLVKSLKQWIFQTSVLEGARSDTPDGARRTRFPPGSGYHIVLSVVNPHPESLKVQFNAEEAVEDYIGTFVDELSLLHNITLKSQWLYLLDFDFQATQIKDNTQWGRHFAVSQHRLPQLLTRLEERTATHVSELPAINLALFAVPCEEAPLIIYDYYDKPVASSVQAFMSPKWGGVMLDSPTAAECKAEQPSWSPDTRVIMGTFISHLRKLLGITNTDPIDGALIEPLKSVVPRRWEIDSLLRIRTLEQITSAERTLQSLAQLLDKISNIVINDEVGASINSAVENIQRAHELISNGELVEGFQTSLKAHLAAEAAFVDPSLLALLYFPHDQKYAIYIPLFLPIMFPVLLSLKKLFLWLQGKPLEKEKTE